MFRKLLLFFKDSFTSGLSGMIGQLAGLFLLPIYTRHLTPADYGVSAMLVIILAVFQTLCSMGVNDAIFKFSRDKDVDNGELQNTAFLVHLTMAILLFTLGLFLLDFFIHVFLDGSVENGKTIICVCFVCSFFQVISASFHTMLRAERRLKHATLINISFLIIQISLSMTLVVVFKFGVLGMLIGQMIGQIVVFILLIYFSNYIFQLKLNLTLAKRMLKYGIYSVPAQILDMLMLQYGSFMIKSSLSLQQSGLFGIAERLTLPIQVVGGSLRTAHTAFFFKILDEEDDPNQTLRAMASVYVALMAYLWLGVSIFGVEVLRFLTTNQYHVASQLIAPIAMMQLLLFIYTIIASGIDSGGDLKPYIVVQLTGVTILITSMYFLINQFGMMGVAYSSILARICMIVVSNYFAQKRLKVPYNYVLMILVVLIASILILINNQFYNSSIGWRTFILLTISVVFPILSSITFLCFPIERKQILAMFKIISKKCQISF